MFLVQFPFFTHLPNTGRPVKKNVIEKNNSYIDK